MLNIMTEKLSIVYMVAGISSRFGGKIKQFARVGPNGETLIEYSVKQAISAGFDHIVFIVGEKTERPFKEMFGDSYLGKSVFYALQKFDPATRDRPWGTGDALCSARHLLHGPFVVCNGDDIYGVESFRILANHLRINSCEATLGFRLGDCIPDAGKTNRGMYKLDSGGKVRKIVETFNIEKPLLREQGLNPDDLCSMNIFALHEGVVDLLYERLSDFKKENEGDRKIEFLLPNELSGLIEENKISMNLYSTPDRWFGVTNPDDEGIVRQQLAVFK
jgi:NDP-sugar pyrophosphorylase family protein